MRCRRNLLVLACCFYLAAGQRVMLVGGDSSCEGQLVIMERGSSEFGLACGAARNQEASVVCTQLGCPPRGAVVSQFNDTPHSLNFTSTLGFGFACNGDETALSECRSQSPLCTADRSNHIAIKCRTATEVNGADAATTSTQQVTESLDVCTAGDGGTVQCFGYCFRDDAVCVEGTCQCINNPFKDRCTCLPIIGSCHIRSDSPEAVGNATHRGRPRSTYSCVANDNCDNEVHVVGSFESSHHDPRRLNRETRPTELVVRVRGESSQRRLILVLSSFRRVRWLLSLSAGVVIDRVIISSRHQSFVRAPPGTIRVMENNLEFYAYGNDFEGGQTEELLRNIYNRFGPITSFTGTYAVDSWSLTIDRGSPDSDCLSAPFELPTLSPPPPTPSTPTHRPRTPPPSRPPLVPPSGGSNGDGRPVRPFTDTFTDSPSSRPKISSGVWYGVGFGLGLLGFLLSVVAGLLRRATTKDRFVVQHWRSSSPRVSNSYDNNGNNNNSDDLFYRFDSDDTSVRRAATSASTASNTPSWANGMRTTGATGNAGVVKGNTSLFSEEPPSYNEVRANSQAAGVVGVAGGTSEYPPPPSYHEVETAI